MDTAVIDVKLVSLNAPNQGTEISISKGSTTIGRGPTFQISDKRVSRSHALLELMDDSIQLKPVHVNPTFHKNQEDNHFQILKKDRWILLKHKDQISLLPEDLKFEVIITRHKNDSTLDLVENNNEGNESEKNDEFTTSNAASFNDKLERGKHHLPSEDNVPKDSTGKDMGNVKDDELMHSTMEQIQNKSPERKDSHSVSLNDQAHKPLVGAKEESKNILKKKRSLPSWMVTASGSKEEDAVPKKRYRKSKAVKETKKSGEVTQSKPEIEKGGKYSRDDATETTPKKDSLVIQTSARCPSDQEDKTRDGSSDPPQPTQANLKGNDTLLHLHVDKDTNEFALAPVTEKRFADMAPSANKSTFSSREEDKAEEKTLHVSSATTTAPLPICPYGSKCYRKNPAHFQEYKHDEPDASATADIPECPYGSRCYRKNPEHFKEYKHSTTQDSDDDQVITGKRKNRKKGHRSVVSDESDDDGEPNTYDYNDSFIDDKVEGSDSASGSSYSFDDDDEDSDFNPGSSDEDVTDLVSEAVSFVGNKKFHKK